MQCIWFEYIIINRETLITSMMLFSCLFFSSTAIPEWAIGTIVVVSVVLVVLVFGGCGLCVAVRNRSGRVDFKEPEEQYSPFTLEKSVCVSKRVFMF